MRRGRLSVLSRSNFAPIAMCALMLFRRPYGGASARALPDLSHAIYMMRVLYGGLPCVSSAVGMALAAIKIFGALEPTRDFGENVGREARNAPKVFSRKGWQWPYALVCK